MLARLWWKEWRTIWPLWVFVLILAGVVQALVLTLIGAEARHGVLIRLALSWAALYAFAVSAAAFAGEREHQTLRWLDVLPVGRPLLWGGKTSFALGSTLLLVAPLAVLGALGTTNRDVAAYSVPALTVGFGALLVECVAWGLFWSALLRHALLAAVLAVVGAGTVAGLLTEQVLFDFKTLDRSAPTRIVLAAALGTVSWLVMTWRPRPFALGRGLPRLAVVSVLIRRTSTVRCSANRSLAWQARRQAVWFWLGACGVSALALLAFTGWTEGRVAFPAVVFVGYTLAGLIAGLCVFHPDNRGRMYRFYVHHGVSPRRVWLMKVGFWSAVVALPATAMGVLVWSIGRHGVADPDRASTIVMLALSLAFYSFAPGVICGQVIERGILAAVVAVGALVVLWLPHGSAVLEYLLPAGVLAVPPVILLAASFAWSRDWVVPSPGAGRWLRLAAWLCLPFAGEAAWAVAYRAWSVPDIGPIAPSTAVASPAASGEAAVTFYEAAVAAQSGVNAAISDLQGSGSQMVKPAPSQPNGFVQASDLDEVVLGRGNPKDPRILAWWNANQKAIDLTRTGSEQPVVGFWVPRTLGPQPAVSPLTSPRHLEALAWLMALDARERAADGGLRQAWDDVRVVWRMAHQAIEGTGTYSLNFAADLDRKASHMAMLWAQDPQQTQALLRTALDELRGMPERLPLGESLRTDAAIWERTTWLPADKLRPLFAEMLGGTPDQATYVPIRRLLVNPWERERARRAGRLFFAYLMWDAEREPWQRSLPALDLQDGRRVMSETERLARQRAGELASFEFQPFRVSTRGREVVFSGKDVAFALVSTPAFRFVGVRLLHSRVPVDRALVDRRALVLVLALRWWALGHDGRLPERLAELVPSVLDRLPLDPYSGRPFGYEPGAVRMAAPLGWFATGAAKNWLDVFSPVVHGARNIYSVGTEDPSVPFHLRGHIVFPIPGRETPRNQENVPEHGTPPARP